jgi:ubiquinone biosynthesis protein UbiJ
MPLESPITAALNHLLRAQPWARERLAPFAGETVEVRASPLPPMRLLIQEDGLVRAGAADAPPSLLVTLKPEAPAAFLRGEEHFLRAVEVSGNAKLADAVMLLVRNLRWDFEEDLSRLVGDVAAHRLAQAARGFAAWQVDAAKRLGEALSDYVTEESGLLAQRSDLEALSRGTASLRDALERLEQRVRRLG